MAGVRVDEVGAGPSTAAEWGYRPHLDGLRTVAVYLVVLFHADVDRLSGGFIGVDVFFVLSGYLVTHLLLRDLAGDGSIGLARFYSRRARRLLPAAAVVLGVTAVVVAAVSSRSEALDALGAMRASALYVANWYFIVQSTDYFASPVEASPVVHFWSLAVEEQFYVVWPLLLGGLWRLAGRAGSRRPTVVRAVVAVAAAASLGAALGLQGGSLARAYYGTDTRAYQLLAGALLALTPGVVARLRGRPGVARLLPVASAVALGALVGVATAALDVGPVTRGALTAALTVALLATLEASTGGPVRWGLSLPPMVYLGRISYGTYLWHWPVIVVVQRELGQGSAVKVLVAVPVATALASLSHQLLEAPIREWRPLDRHRAPVIAAGLAVSLVVAVVLVPVGLRSGATSDHAVAADDSRVATDDAAVDWSGVRDDTMDFPPCAADDPPECTLVEGSGGHVLLVGDSHALTLVPMLEELARERDLTFSAAVTERCPWMRGVHFRWGSGPTCESRKESWYDVVVPALDPDVVVLAHRAVDDPMNATDLVDVETGALRPTDVDFRERFGDRVRATVDALVGDGRRVVIIEPIPVSTQEDAERGCHGGLLPVAECRFVATPGPTAMESVYREVGEDTDGAWSLDLDRLVCPHLPICDPVVDGLVVRRDPVHLTLTYARTLAGPFGAALVDLGVVDRP